MKARKTHIVLFRKRVWTRPRSSGRFSVPNIIKRVRVLVLELTYLPHLLLRFLHDYLYHKAKVYRKYSDHPASEVVHRAALGGFLVSVIISMSLQLIVPHTIDIFTPREARAFSNTKTWQAKNDFTSNAISGGTAGPNGTWDDSDDTMRTTRTGELTVLAGGGIQKPLYSVTLSSGVQGSRTVAVGGSTIAALSTAAGLSGYNGTTVFPQFNVLTLNGPLTTTAGVPLKFYAKTLTINAGGSINADGKGYAGGAAEGNGQGTGGGAGGSPGSVDGDCFGATPAGNGGPGIYVGDVDTPDMGAGGGGGGNLNHYVQDGHDENCNWLCAVDYTVTPGTAGGAGGGAMYISADSIGINASSPGITAKGENPGGNGGSGSGGGIRLTTLNTFSNASKISVSSVSSNGGAVRIYTPSGITISGINSVSVGGTYTTGLYGTPPQESNLGGVTSGYIGLRMDMCNGVSSCGVEANLTQISSSFGTLISGQAVKYLVRTSSNGTTWQLYNRAGTAIADSTIATAWSSGYFGKAYGDASTITTPTIPIPKSRYLEIVIQLENSSASNLTVSSVTLGYNEASAPTGLNATTSPGGQAIVTFTGSPTVNLNFTGNPTAAGTVTTQVRLQSVNYGSPAPLQSSWLETDSPDYTGSANEATANENKAMTVQVSSLSSGKTYYWRARYVDSAGVQSPWSPSNSPGSFTYDAAAPTEASNPFALKATSASTSNLIKPSDTYYVYANATDALSGVAGVTANVSAITTGSTTVALSAAGGPWTVNSISYAYRSVLLTADAGLTNGAKSSYLTTTDNAGNTFTNASAYSVIADTVAPTITSVTSTNVDNTYYKIGGSINITVNFSELITTTSNLAVNLNSGGSCNFAVTNANNGSCNYGVGTGENASPLNSSSITGTLTDQAGNAMSSFTPGTNLSASKNLVVDTVAPSASNTPTSDSYANNIGTQTITWDEFVDSAPSSGFGNYVLQRRKLPAATFSDVTTITSSSTVTSYTDHISDGSGTYYYRIVTTDAAGNSTNGSESLPVIIDNIAPSGSLQINSNDRATDNGTVNLSFTLTDDFSGVHSYEIDNGDGNWQDFTDISTSDLTYTGSVVGWSLLSPLVEGEKTVRIRLFDKAGNSVSNITDTIIVDNTDPDGINAVVAYKDSGQDPSDVLSEAGYTGGWYSYNTPNFSIIASDQVSGIKEFRYCMVKGVEVCDLSATATTFAATANGGTSYKGDVSVSLNDSRQGVLTFQVVGLDYVGRLTSTSTYTYKFDGTIPSYVQNFKATPNSGHPAPYEDKIVLTWDKSSNASPVAPVEYYKIERLAASSYTGINDGAWENLTTYQTITCQTASPYACLDKNSNNIGTLALYGSTYTFENSPAADGTLNPSTRYIYRISAKDYANDSYGPVPGNGSENQNEVYGYTKDTAAPETPATSVTASPCDGASSDYCNSDLTKRGKRVKVSWLPAADALSGIEYYEIYRREGGPNDLNGWIKVGQLTETVDGPLVYRVYYDDSIADAKWYSYRIVAVDAARPLPANSTQLIPGGLINDVTNASEAVYIYDVTAPTIPATFSVQAMGIDCFDPECTPHQQANISWQKTTDNNPNVTVTYKLYRSTSADSGYSEIVAASALTPDEQDSYLYEDKGLNDKTTYYYKLEVSDNVSPTPNVALSNAMSLMTGNSLAPNQPTYVTVSNSDAALTDKAHQLKVTFTGSAARAFDEVTKENGVVRYDAYMTKTNILPDKSRSPLDGTANDCELSETADDCWIRINSATNPVDPITIDPAGDDNLKPAHTFIVSGLDEATQYFFRIRATDNGVNPDNSPAPLTSILSSVLVNSPTDKAYCGWNITRDLSAPELPAGGLEVKVKDTYPNSTLLRNIVSWKILTEEPLRPKLSYEESVEDGGNCKLVVQGGVDYCNDFYSYEVYRQVKDANGNVVAGSTVLRRTETNPETNLFIDEIGNLELIDGLGAGALLKDQQIVYYVKVVDASYVNFAYPNGTHINSVANSTTSQYSDHAIMPSMSTPSVVGNHITVDPNQIGVSVATITWQTNQETDALVAFKEKYLRDANGKPDTSRLNTGEYRVIGASTTPGESRTAQSHTVNLFGLKPDTPYVFTIESRNYLGNNVDLTNVTIPEFRTKAFTITPPNPETDIITTTTGATINWSTNLDASSAFVEYTMNTQPGDEPQGKTVGVSPEDIAQSPRNFKLVISGLKSTRTYTYKIKSISTDGFVAETGFSTFRTNAFDTAAFTLAPSSSNVNERNITATSAQIVWQTAVPTTNWVRYGTEAGKYIYAAGDNGLSTSHAVQIDGLIPGTTYYYIIDVKDANDTPYTSKEYSFTAVLKPKISNFKVVEVKPYSFTISWDTNIDTETMINLGKSIAYGEKRGKSGYTKSHQLVVDSLEDNTEYHYQILAKDSTGFEVASEDEIVRTPMDTQGPKITGVKVDVLPMGENDNTSSVIISWQTDKPATTLVEYDPGIIGGDYNNRSFEDRGLSNSHTVIIKGLQPASSYHYRLVSKDKRGNETVSQDYTFVTPSKEKSILQMILKSLEETFAWTKNLGQFFSTIGKRLTGKS